MFPRNAASPERLLIGQVVLIADGTVQSAGVAIVVRGQGGAEAAGAGTIAYSATDNSVYYTPTQAETDFTSFTIIAWKASCFSADLTVVTTASATSGKVVLSGETHTSAVIPTVSDVTNQVTANMTAISGDAVAADNLELQYDTTGLTGDTFPSTQSQLGALTVGSAGIATTANSGTTVTTGTETLTYASTVELDGVYHEVAVNVSIDMYYEFDISSSGVPISIDWTGYVQSNSDNVEVYFYNWVGAVWEQVGTITGSNGTTAVSNQFTATTAHVGTGGDVGKVRFRMASSGGDVATNIATDRIVCTYTQAVTGIANGSTVTLAAATTNTNLIGNNWSLASGGQDISGSYIKGATITGIASGTTAVTLEDCKLGAGTYPPGTYIRCGFGLDDGLFTAASAGQYYLKDCYSIVAGSGTPDFTFAGLGSATGINNRGWLGGSAWTLDTNCTLSHEVIAGGGTTITPADAAVELRGTCRSVTIALADTDVGNTIQAIIDTGPLVITSAASGDSATINLYGSAQSLADGSSVGTTVNDYLSGFVQTDAILGDTNELQTDDVPGLIAVLPTAAENADQVWIEAIADHDGVGGSTAEQLSAAGSAGDPWATALPGAYGAGSAGKIVGDNIDSPISSIPTTAMRGTDDGATALALATAQADLDKITGSDGATLATAQANYAPAKAGDSMDVLSISGDPTAADNLEASLETLITGTATGTPTTTTMADSALTEATNDHYKGRIIIWRTGALLGQATDITSYNGTTKTYTFTATTEAATAGDAYVVV